MGTQPDYSIQVATEIDEEVRKLIEAAHTEAWEILRTYRDVLDNLVFELLEKETLTRKDLQRIFTPVEKRPRITAFNDFGGRTPSDKPPILSPAERAKERGEPWPPEREREKEPAPVGSVGGGHKGLPTPTPGGGVFPSPNGGPTGPNGGPPYGALPSEPKYPAGTYHPRHGAPSEHPESAVPPNYGAPPDWRPAITPPGQEWPPPKWNGQDRARVGDRETAQGQERSDPDGVGRAGGSGSGEVNGGWTEPGQGGER
jgi:cell division protease FtsH